MKNIDRKSITIWNIESIIPTLIIGLIVGVNLYFFNEYEWITKVSYLAMSITILFLTKGLIMSPIIFKRTNYQLNEEKFQIKKGGLSVRESTIPLKRIQHVDIEQSFLSRLFNLYRLNIYTAGDSHNIEYIQKEEAELLKEQIVNYVSGMGMEGDVSA